MKLDTGFFQDDVLDVASQLLGNILVRRLDSGKEMRFVVTETEAYRGEDDLACHASKGRTKRTEVLYHSGGEIYIYLIYGMYWLFNVVAGKEGFPAGVLIRGLEDEQGNQILGSGKVGRCLLLDKSFYGEDLAKSERIWFENGVNSPEYQKLTRVGVDYAGEWAKKLWRFRLR